MSEKKAKLRRKLIRETIEFLEPIEPIVEEALSELESAELFEDWSTVAVVLKQLKPEIPLEDLLPNNIERTLNRYPDFFEIISSSKEGHTLN